MCKSYKVGQKEFQAGKELEFEDLGYVEFSETRIHPSMPVLKGKWAGSATFDKLKSYWLSKRRPGNQLVQIRETVTEISETDQDTGEDIWLPAPEGTRIFFILEASPPGKSYRLAKLVTIKATPEELAYFNQVNDTVPFTGKALDGELVHVPLPNPPQRLRTQGNLF